MGSMTEALARKAVLRTLEGPEQESVGGVSLGSKTSPIAARPKMIRSGPCSANAYWTANPFPFSPKLHTNLPLNLP